MGILFPEYKLAFVSSKRQIPVKYQKGQRKELVCGTSCMHYSERKTAYCTTSGSNNHILKKQIYF